MWTENKIYEEDLKRICDNKSILNKLEGSTILVTGAAGLIGQTLINALLYAGRNMKNGPAVLAFVRNIDRAKKIFGKQSDMFPDHLRFIEGDVTGDINIPYEIDYIIHAASRTSSKGFIEEPVETINTAYKGTDNILKLAIEKNVRSVIYLSTMEIYGYPDKGHKVTENDSGSLSALKVRNCYPLSKQLCENLCCAYASEYNVPVKILRLTQTFGPGVKYNDGRVFAEFARCVIEKKDIVLKTKGETERCYLYTADAVSAILTVLVNGENGHAYNAANENSYCSIARMAQTVSALSGNKVIFELQDTSGLGYADTLYMNLDTSALRSLGWNAKTDLEDMFRRMIACMTPQES